MNASTTVSSIRPSAFVVRLGIGAIVATAVVGGLHHPLAAPLLRAISPAFMCPVRHGTPAQIDRAHDLGATAIRESTTATAPTRPALGFVLDETTKTDVATWAKAQRVSCSAIGGNENLQKCVDVPASALGDTSTARDEVTFEFRSSGELVNVQTMRRRLSPENAASIVGDLEKRTASELGAPTSEAGEATNAHLSRSALASYVAVHSFHDYRATVSATNLAHTGVMVREDYISTR